MKETSTFGSRLRISRKEKNLTQKALADVIGAKHNSVSDWENDKNMPDPDMIVSLCEALNVSPGYLLSKENESDKDWNAVNSADVLYISKPSGDMKADEVRKFLHETIDSLSDSDLEFFKDFTLRMKK